MPQCDKKVSMNVVVKSENKIVSPRVFRTALFGVLFVGAAALTGIGALFALSGNEGQAESALPALRLNLFIILALGIYLFMRLRAVLFTSDSGQSAPHLHRRFILIFSLAALVPAILVGLFFTALMNRNLNDIFGPTVRQTMEASKELSSAYFREEYYEIGQDVYLIAEDLNRVQPQLSNRITYTEFLINLAVIREFPVVYVVDGQGRILSQAEGPEPPAYVLPSAEAYAGTQDGSVAFMTRGEIDFVGVLYKLENYADAYLYTGRYLQTGMLTSIKQINQVERSLDQYSGNFDRLNRVFFLTYIEVAALIFFAAIWLALFVADKIVSPLGSMVNAAEKVRAGDLATRINVTGVWDEISDLANAFNRMTRQLYTQREDLVREHDISEQRREFSEAVLSGVSAGVIGLSLEGKITVINRSAEVLLGLQAGAVVGQPLSSVLNGFMPAFTRAVDNLDHISEDQVNLETPNGMKNLDLRVSPYQGKRANTGWVLTFDDMTRLVAAQRHSAWREVARRIAHEIKNPLTPIQLSAERLERKYKGEIKSDPEVFSQCTQTIIRQVSNLGRMVDEFSAFARMPAPVLQLVDLEVLIQDTLFAQRVAFPDIAFTYLRKGRSPKKGNGKIEVLCDERLIAQALANIYKNAAESIARRIDGTGRGTLDGKITTHIRVQKGVVELDILDNGEGWPLEDKDRLLEPYMTTRDEGSGLGLAIVKRIVEDHGGTLELYNRKDTKRGAYVQLCLPQTETGPSPEIPAQLPTTHSTSPVFEGNLQDVSK
ncbi:MAG: PAS domain-containing sensor histidine kinase [Robiginitomaculum sp.]|nr:MAG: PAS domain-containing sensor histidine kinase [Robiginitomaculum sp.]